MQMPSNTTSLVGWSEPSTSLPALVCIPWAGAGAAPFRSWAEAFEGHADVYAARLPGRESRLLEPPPASLSAMVDDVARVVGALPHPRLALFGHCSGAVIAFELARRLGTRTSSVIHLLVASQLPPPRVAETDVAELEAEERMIRREVEETFAAEPELCELMLACLVADIRAVATYRYEAGELLDVPISVFVGSNDDDVRVADAEGWRAETSAPVRVHELEGAGHLFRGDAWSELALAVRSELVGSAPPTSARGAGSTS